MLAVLIIGERNFFSTQVNYQTEPIASIGRVIRSLSTGSDLLTNCCAGQWAPIVGTGLALFGSLYVALAAQDSRATEGSPTDGHHGSPSDCSQHDSEGPRRSNDNLARTHTHVTLEGTRRTVAGWLNTVAEYVGTPQERSYNDAGFRGGRSRAMEFPELPGEWNRNKDLPQLIEQWSPSRDPSRAPSVRSATGRATRERSDTADTLQVPSPTHLLPSRNDLDIPTQSQATSVTPEAREQNPPIIIISCDLDTSQTAVTARTTSLE
jgi:hypothetical protein